MSDLPDLTTAPAWLDAAGNAWATNDIVAEVGPGCIAASNAPWTPLRTSEDWASRINRDKLAEVIDRALQEWHDGDLSGTDHDAVADAALAALPELMGGEQA